MSSAIYDIDSMDQTTVKKLMDRHKGLNSSIIYYALRKNCCCLMEADLELKERRGQIKRKAVYSSKHKIPKYDQYLNLNEIEECIDDVLAGSKLLILIRGLPGSGKSSLATSILKACLPNAEPTNHIHSTDRFFLRKGVYTFDSSLLSDAHAWNQKNVDRKMSMGLKPIIVDNTNTQLWEMKSYLGMAVKHKYKIRVIDMSTRWSLNINELKKKNQHNVPKVNIENMLLRYESMGITGEQLLEHFKFPLGYLSPSNKEKCRRSKISKELKSSEEDSSSDHSPEEKPRNQATKDKPATETIKHNFAFSWDTETGAIVKSWTDLNIPQSNNIVIEETKPDTCESSTNTCIADFHAESANSKCIYGRCREINSGKQQTVRYKSGMLDKSCSTQNDVCSDRSEDLERLIDVFPNIPPMYIRDIYDDCKGNFDMTFEIFLEDNKDYSHLSFTSDNVISKPSEEQQQQEMTKSVYEELLNEPSTSTARAEMYETDGITTPECCNSEEEITDVSSPLESDSDQSSGRLKGSSTNSETIMLDISQKMVEQLREEFGYSCNDWPAGFQTEVQVPKVLAKQLYAFYVESIYQQIDAQKSILESITNEDAAFAQKLYEEEIGKLFGTPTPVEGFKDIMNEQAAMKIQQKELPKLKTPNDLAFLLSKKKLCEAFPTLEEKLILEVYHANDFNYQQTFDDLASSLGVTCVNSELREPPISQSTLQELQAAQEDTEQYKDKLSLKSEGESEKTAQDYRKDADHHLRKRQELHQKAQDYYKTGQTGVAMFYSEMAKEQTQLYDEANNKAACLLLDRNAKSMKNINALDLHHLYVKEAVSALDIFLDNKIAELKTSQKRHLELLIITGRGNRSVNGVARLKPAVSRRLQSRQLKYTVLNPGVLKVKIFKSSRVTNDFKEKGP